MKIQALSAPVLLVSWIFCFLLWVYWPIKHVVFKPAIGSPGSEGKSQPWKWNQHLQQQPPSKPTPAADMTPLLLL